MITLISPDVIFYFLNTYFNQISNEGKYITMNHSPYVPFARSSDLTRLKLLNARDI